MKTMYFELFNGRIVKPGILPAYRITLNWRLQITKFEVCFATRNIEQRGMDWAETELEQVRHNFKNYKWIKKSLRTYIWRNLFTKYDVNLPDWFVYLQISNY